MTDLPMPASLDEVTADWLTAALSQRYPGTVVTSAIRGTTVRATGTKMRLMLEYNDAGHAHRLPPTMWFKSGLEEHSDHVRTSHARESLFYREIEPLGPLNAPHGYYAETDAAGYSAQLFEDLLARNARFGSASRPVSIAVAGQTLDMLARLHAHWWRAPELEKLGPPGGSLATDGIVIRILTDEAWAHGLARQGADLPPEFQTGAGVRAGMEKLWEYDRTSDALCMVHGDPHPGNMFFEQDDRPGFLDYQRLMQCDWAHDVNYFLISSCDADDMAAHERDLLERYLETREALGVLRMDRDAAWLSYRRHTMYGLVWNAVPAAMQTEETCAIISSRFNAAAARHDVAGALEL